MSVNDYDEQLDEAIKNCLEEGFLNEEEQGAALGVAHKVIHVGYNSLTRRQKELYDDVVVPALEKLHSLHERIRFDNTD